MLIVPVVLFSAGVDNVFLANARTAEAQSWPNSINEHGHLQRTRRLLAQPGCDVLAHLPASDCDQVMAILEECILATDPARHGRLMAQHEANVAQHGPDVATWTSPPARRALLATLLRAADLANPSKPWALSQQWADRIISEFWSQGDREVQQGLPLSPQCRRQQADIRALQTNFMQQVVQPMLQQLQPVAPVTVRQALQHLATNLQHWQALRSSPAGSASGCETGDGPQHSSSAPS